MENEEKKDVTAPEKAPQETPEELAKKLRDKNDLRIFGIAFMAAVIVVAVYHIGRMVHREYFNKYKVKSCKCRPVRSCKCGQRRGRPHKKDGAPAAEPAPAPNAAAQDAKPVEPAGEQK